MFNAASYNWLYHHQLVHSGSGVRILPDLAEHVECASNYANYTRAVSARHEGEVHQSLATFRGLLKTDSANRVELLGAASRSMYLVGKYKQAAESLNHVKRQKGEMTWKDHLAMGKCYRAANIQAQAFDEVEKSINKNGNDANLGEMADIMLMDGKRDEAIRYLRQGLELYPDSPKLNIKLGTLLADLLLDTRNVLTLDDTTAAVTCLTLASKVESDAHLVIGTLLQLVASDDCIGHYRQLYAVDPASHQMWNNLGLLSHQKGKRLAALACCRRAAYLNPLDHVPWLNLTLLYLLNGQLSSALNAINTSLALQRDSFAFDIFGLVLLSLNQCSNAKKAFSKASKLRKSEAKVDLTQMYGGIYNRALAYLDSEPNKTRMILDKELKLETIKEKKLDTQLMSRIEQLHAFVQ